MVLYHTNRVEWRVNQIKIDCQNNLILVYLLYRIHIAEVFFILFFWYALDLYNYEINKNSIKAFFQWCGYIFHVWDMLEMWSLHL